MSGHLVPIGTTLGMLTLQRRTRRTRYGHWYGEFRCECGAAKEINIYNVTSGRVVSCGCHGARRRSESHRIHGHLAGGETSPEYRVWSTMKHRCQNPKASNYERYGGRGIRVCERWQTFAAFIADMGQRPSPRHSIDRIDNDGNYEPGNCRWATPEQQRANRRRAQ